MTTFSSAESKEQCSRLLYIVKVLLHPIRTIPVHFFRDMPIDSKGKCCIFFPFERGRIEEFTSLGLPQRVCTDVISSSAQAIKAQRKRWDELIAIIVEKLLAFYFANAYSAWQRGSNENSCGLLREFYPKKTDMAKVSQQELIRNLFRSNNRKRKCLGWKSPIQVFLHEVVYLT